MIGIIAGAGSLPLDACNYFMAKGKSFFIISLFPEDNKKLLAELVGNKAAIFELPFYQAGSILELLQRQQTRQVLFIGKVDKKNLLKNIRYDWLGIKLLGSLLYKNDKALMESIIKLLKTHGISVVTQDTILNGLIVSPGLLCGSLTPHIEHDIQYGLATAQQLSQIDIGQTVVVKNGMIIAVEAIEGTDECIKRAIALAQSGLVICKGTRLGHNRQYDLPTLGPTTLEALVPGQVIAIAWQSTSTLIASQLQFIKKAQTLGITLVSI